MARRWAVRHPLLARPRRTVDLVVRPLGTALGDGRHGQLGSDQGEASRLLRAPAHPRIGDARRICRPGRDPVLCVFRVHPRTAVLPDWHLGARRPPPCRGEVFHLHPRRERAGVLGPAHDRPLECFPHRHALLRHRQAHRRPGGPSAPDGCPRGLAAVVGIPRPVCRFRRQGADRPLPHLAAAGPRRGADGGKRRSRRRAAEDRHLRIPPLLPPDAPRGHRRGRPLDARSGGRRNPLRGAGGAGPERSQAAHRLFVGESHGLLRDGDRGAGTGGCRGSNAPVDQPRSVGGGAVRAGRDDLRALPHALDRESRRDRGAGPMAGVHVHPLHLLEHRAAGAEWLRG